MDRILFLVSRKLASIFGGDNIRYVIELREGNLGRLFYNKGLILINEFFRFLSFFSPKLYFRGFLFVLFPFWVLGLMHLIEKRKYKVFIILGFLGIIAYLLDQRELIYIFPIGLVYLYIIWEGIFSLFRR